MHEVIFDIEADGLELKDVTKVHCLSYCRTDGDMVTTLFSYSDIQDFFKEGYRYIGHNVIMYDFPTLEKICDVVRPPLSEIVDTLPLSWTLFPKRPKHGLENWGEEFGVPKPKIEDWSNLSPAEYAKRCEEDVKINTRLWELERKKLERLYG